MLRFLAGMIFSLVCVVPSALAQGDQPAADARDISTLLAPIIKKHNVPAIAGAIVEGDRVVVHGCAGVRKAGEEEKVTLADKFHLGSCTKSMTATMIATLVEEGKLKWDTTVGEVFPDVTMNERWKTVRLEQLLTNSAAPPAGLDADGLWGTLMKRTGTPTEQRMALVRGVLANPPEAEPGTKFIYSNAGFAIAGAMAEKVTGTSWEDLMRQRLFEPLGMTSAGFGAPGKRGTIDQPRGHGQDGAAIEPGPFADNPPAIGPAGIVHCTIDDWAKYAGLHVEGARGKARFLKAETFTKLHTPAMLGKEPSSYAMGWGITARDWAKGDKGTARVLTHSGSNTMWYCVAWLAPEKNFAVVIACNEGGDAAAKACDEAAWALISSQVERTR